MGAERPDGHGHWGVSSNGAAGDWGPGTEAQARAGWEDLERLGAPHIPHGGALGSSWPCPRSLPCLPQIQRVQNRVLWVSYCWQRHWMEEKNLPGELNERLLYHGTQPENRHSIQEIGLRITCRKGGSGPPGDLRAGGTRTVCCPCPPGHPDLPWAQMGTWAP